MSRFISGIYNYCDYWCERCPFTRRCRNYSMGRELERQAKGETPMDDATHAAFWNRLAEKVRQAAILAKANPETPDDEFKSDAIPDIEWETREQACRQAVHQHPLVRLAETYMQHVGTWLKTADGDLKAAARDLLASAESPFATDDHEEKALEIGEMIEVVAWYHTFIPPKLARAVSGLLDRGSLEGENHPIIADLDRQDALGTGKVVLVAMERSIAAWLRLREVLPNQEDDILECLALLNRLHRGIRAALPGAQAFRRPGFDGGTLEDADDTDAFMTDI